jgi:hypothetical protein
MIGSTGVDELLNVIVTSWSAATLFAVVCACVCSVTLTALAVPPSAVVSIFTVAVAVPDVHLLVTLVILNANGDGSGLHGSHEVAVPISDQVKPTGRVIGSPESQ